ncbi:hypothetical protein [Xenorhabdus sp. KJ12.1]|uniref:hypothetical protein n=1 Tax=Xenorhabdus sp. KJ12.1 TaxID=1851571 RepID=UPI000C04DDCF|nr:hypothetical protein [Xenorhabdus sp. KJ12.1]
MFIPKNKATVVAPFKNGRRVPLSSSDTPKLSKTKNRATDSNTASGALHYWICILFGSVVFIFTSSNIYPPMLVDGLYNILIFFQKNDCLSDAGYPTEEIYTNPILDLFALFL